MSSQLTFLGAARTVTGSKYLLELGGHRVLVDCGLYQGLKELRRRNWAPLPVDPSSIDAVILTHAHLDHSGYLPRLVSQGFRGRVFCTPGTKDLCTLVLPDSARIQEEDAHHANRHAYSKHVPALPLYTEQDAARALERLQPLGYDRTVGVAPGIDVTFRNAGHLLGSAFAVVRCGDRRILFGGDLGRYDRPVLPDPVDGGPADVLLLESTYGDRLHEQDDQGTALASYVKETVERGGKLIIPSFAIGRVEEVLYWLKRLEEARRIPVLPVYVDSPMAVHALQFYLNRLNELDPELDRGERELCGFYTSRLTTIDSAQESKDLIASRHPAIIIASSGMATGGRVLGHLEAALPVPENTILFVGYQAAGTRGRQLCDGATEIKIHGHLVSVRSRIARIDSMSAHADSREIMRWLSSFKTPPSMTHLVHGEPAALEALQERIEGELHWPVQIASYLAKVEI
jgi:metallo-beta-lactamase family protein